MNTLPEDCIAKILSFTTPLDVCRLSAVSKIFSSAADSDDVWNHFLPTVFPEGFVAQPTFQSRKQLFFSLVHHPLLLHDSRLSFWLDRRSGNKCYMLAARSLEIAWGDDQSNWKWISIPNTRFREVTELIWVCWFDITGKINITLLSDNTLYAAYLVFNWNDDPSGFGEPGESVEASVFLTDTHTVDAQPSMVSLMQNPGNEEGQSVELRRDGWFEVELGHFFKRKGDLGELKMNLKETKRRHMKEGLIVLGIEIRPMP